MSAAGGGARMETDEAVADLIKKPKGKGKGKGKKKATTYQPTDPELTPGHILATEMVNAPSAKPKPASKSRDLVVDGERVLTQITPDDIQKFRADQARDHRGRWTQGDVNALAGHVADRDQEAANAIDRGEEARETGRHRAAEEHFANARTLLSAQLGHDPTEGPMTTNKMMSSWTQQNTNGGPLPGHEAPSPGSSFSNPMQNLLAQGHRTTVTAGGTTLNYQQVMPSPLAQIRTYSPQIGQLEESSMADHPGMAIVQQLNQAQASAPFLMSQLAAPPSGNPAARADFHGGNKPTPSQPLTAPGPYPGEACKYQAPGSQYTTRIPGNPD